LTDIVDKKTRSRMMSGIKGADTKPEMLVRKGLHAKGFRYRLHEKNLPGRPDLYFPKFKAVIQVNGCFWHKHHCKYFKLPSSRPEFWRKKLEANAVRDERNQYQLSEQGYRTLIIWECAFRGQPERVAKEVLSVAAGWLEKGNCDLVIP